MNNNTRFLLSMGMRIEPIQRHHIFKGLVYCENDGYFMWRTKDGNGTVDYVRLKSFTDINAMEVRTSFIIITEVGI